jgi:N-acetylglutamate synthase-like GNAT family acetyltransferase
LLNSNLQSVFHPQHEFLFVINNNDQLIGGVFWKKSEQKLAYLERIVIHQDYRNRRLSSHLLDELFSRLRDKHYEYVNVGFFQARLFYNKGFSINRRFGGLVKPLN